LALTGLSGVVFAPALAQQPEPTPLPAEFPTLTPTPQGGMTATPSSTSTPQGLAYAEAIDEANVRTGPGTDFDRIGSIFSGDKHVVLGIRRGYPWVKIQFIDPEIGATEAWVYRELVELSGNVDGIPLIEGEEVPTQNPLLISMQETLDVLTLTPGALGTATALAGLFPTGEPTEAGPTSTRLPTFTPPPVGTANPSDYTVTGQRSSDNGLFGMPPAIPIIVLAALGVIGLIFSVVRRLT
jgi:hypothetical protein